MNLEGAQFNFTIQMTEAQNHAGAETHSEPDVSTQTDSDANKQTYNILLIGETGVGKSTFVNAFFYYLTYESLDDALKAKDITALVPTKFTIMGDDYHEEVIVYGEDENESVTPGASATQAPRSYTFNLGNSIIRIIDTPGVGNTRGMSVDEKNFDLLLATIAELKDMHAICIVLKPNNARLDVLFQYCIKQLLSRLEKSARRNIVFLFTNSRGTLYRPGETLVPLKAVIKEIAEQPPNVIIPFGKKNVFCIDNEAFRFLIANNQGIKFNDDERDDFAASWKKSSRVCFSLLNYVIKLKPHKIQDSVSINESRRLISRLSRPLAEITDNIELNLELIRRNKVLLSESKKSIEDLNKKLNLTILRTKAIKIRYPRTVCTDISCVEIFKIDEDKRRHIYRTICDKRCYLIKVEPKLVGDPALVNCIAMKRQHCTVCNHHFTTHMHITYVSILYAEVIKYEEIISDIDSEEAVKQKLEKVIRTWEELKMRYEFEREMIQKSMAKFAHFLANNAITTYNDKYIEYIDFLIDRENSLGDARNMKAIERYTQLVEAYEEKKKILDGTLAKQQCIDGSVTTVVTAQQVKETVDLLYELDLIGTTVKEFFDVQDSAMKYEMLTSTEKTYTPPEDSIIKLIAKIPSLF